MWYADLGMRPISAGDIQCTHVVYMQPRSQSILKDTNTSVFPTGRLTVYTVHYATGQDIPVSMDWTSVHLLHYVPLLP